MVSISEKKKIIMQVLNAKISPAKASEALGITLMEVWGLVDKYGTDRFLTQSEWQEVKELEENALDIVRKNVAAANKPEIVTSVGSVSSYAWIPNGDYDVKRKSKRDTNECIISAGTP